MLNTLHINFPCCYDSGFLLILLLETFAGKCLGGRGLKRRHIKKVKKKFYDDNKKMFDDDNKEEKQMPKTPDTVQMVERLVELSNKHQIQQTQNSASKIQNTNLRWVDGESFPGQKSSINKGYSQPTEMQMTENGCGSSETGKEEADSKTKTTFFYSDPSRVQPSSHPYPSSALPDHHLVCSVSLLSFASYSHRLGNASKKALLPPWGSPR